MLSIYETENFIVAACSQPHVSRTDGGHMVIFPREPVVNRWELDPSRAQALMRLSMVAGEAMTAALNEKGITVERINFQDNGNWGIGTREGPQFHLHLYGRARNSQHQTHGEALHFPHKKTQFWKGLDVLNDGDRNLIRQHIERLVLKERYSFRTWGLGEG
jgi:diadenosine tetraphosphate (Ap4A) HIT family hydrolase